MLIEIKKTKQNGQRSERNKESEEKVKNVLALACRFEVQANENMSKLGLFVVIFN